MTNYLIMSASAGTFAGIGPTGQTHFVDIAESTSVTLFPSHEAAASAFDNLARVFDLPQDAEIIQVTIAI